MVPDGRSCINGLGNYSNTTSFYVCEVGVIFTPVLVRCLLGPLGLSGPMTNTSWTHSYNPPPAAHLHPPHSLPACQSPYA